MRKLVFLKTIVDFLWIMSIIAFPLLIVFISIVLFSNEPIDIPIYIIGTELDFNTVIGKIGLVLGLVNFGVLLYALYYFKALLKNFSKIIIFEADSYKLLDKIGNLVILFSSLYLITGLLGSFSKSTVKVNLGFEPFLYLMALGLFFKVLSEVFIIGKRIKEDSELTI